MEIKILGTAKNKSFLFCNLQIIGNDNSYNTGFPMKIVMRLFLIKFKKNDS